MTSSRIFKLLLLLSALAAMAALWSWHETGGTVDRLYLRAAIALFGAAAIVGIVGADTRPRLMLRFLAALFALVAVIAYAADFSKTGAAASQGSGSMLDYLQNFAPVLVAATQATIERWLGAFVWDPLLTTLLSLPAYLIFLLLAFVTGFASRPRHRVHIFINDR